MFKELKENKWELVKAEKLNDEGMFGVIVKRKPLFKDREYVFTHYNASNGFFWSHYDLTLKEAENRLNDKLETYKEEN